MLPNSLVGLVINLIILAGILGISAGWIGRWFPIVNTYAPALRIIGVVLLVLGSYLLGGQSADQVWRDRVSELEERVRIAERSAAEANSKIETVYVDRVQIIQDHKATIQEDIRKNSSRIDLTCTVDPSVVNMLNAAARPPSGDKK